jgi:hypothetical protein
MISEKWCGQEKSRHAIEIRLTAAGGEWGVQIIN